LDGRNLKEKKEKGRKSKGSHFIGESGAEFKFVAYGA
jgi:hypothetical protein